MTKQEAAKIIYTIISVYPNQFKNQSPQILENLTLAWAGALEDYTYEQVSAGLKLYLLNDKKGFAPSPGQVVDMMMQAAETYKQDMSAFEAWHYIRIAARNGTYGAEEEFAKLPDMCKKVIGTPSNIREMAQMSEEDVETIEQSHFIRAYNAAIDREKNRARIPESARVAIGHSMGLIKDTDALEGEEEQ